MEGQRRLNEVEAQGVVDKPGAVLPPEDRSSTASARLAKNPSLIVTIRAQPPHFYLNTRPTDLAELQKELSASAAAQGTNATVIISMDKEAPAQDLFDVMSAANGAKVQVQVVQAYAYHSSEELRIYNAVGVQGAVKQPGPFLCQKTDA